MRIAFRNLQNVLQNMLLLQLAFLTLIHKSTTATSNDLGKSSQASSRNKREVIAYRENSLNDANLQVYDSRKSESRSHLSQGDIEKLEQRYGTDVVNQHFAELDRLLRSQAMSGSGPNYDIIRQTSFVNGEPVIENQLHAVNWQDSTEISKKKLIVDPIVIKRLLQEVLSRIDVLETTITEKVSHPESGHCNIHGVWLSTVAGAAIELLPTAREGHIEINTRILDLPDLHFRGGIITSQWTGRGMISQESPTTITIVFQQHFDPQQGAPAPNYVGGESEVPEGVMPLPKTAVFVGQCLVCGHSPVLQGTWVVFPNTQKCAKSGKEESHDTDSTSSYRKQTSDTIYLLKR